MSNDTTAADSETRLPAEPSRERLMHEIVSTVAEANACSPLDLEPVSNVVDPDALEALLATPDTTVAIKFMYEGGLVRVNGSGVQFEDV